MQPRQRCPGGPGVAEADEGRPGHRIPVDIDPGRGLVHLVDNAARSDYGPAGRCVQDSGHRYAAGPEVGGESVLSPQLVGSTSPYVMTLYEDTFMAPAGQPCRRHRPRAVPGYDGPVSGGAAVRDTLVAHRVVGQHGSDLVLGQRGQSGSTKPGAMP